MTPNTRRRTRRLLNIALLTCLAVSVFCVVYPLFVIQPFRAQGSRELSLALAVARYRPVLTIISAAITGVVFMLYWRVRGRTLSTVLYASGLLTACALAFLGRVNIFELMFHPV